MKTYYDRHIRDAPKFKVGDKVWLDARNLRIRQPSRKLSHKRLGPYPVIEKLGELNYRLKLLPTVPVHPVFHVSLLTKHNASEIPGRTPPEPPPVTVEGDEEYEVERILDSRLHRRRLQYLVRWKDWGPEHDSWEPAENLTHAPGLVKRFYAKFPKSAS